MDKLDKEYRLDPEPEAVSLTAQQENEFRGAFELYDVEGTGQVPLSSLGLVLRSLGLAPIPSTLEALKEKKVLEGETSLTFAEFVHLVQHQETATESRRISAETKAAQLQRSFHIWDPAGTGFVRATGDQDDPLTLFKRSMEETMEAQEVQRLLSTCREADGSVNYVQLCSFIAS